MDYSFNGFCKCCPNNDLCFEGGICVRRFLGPEFDDDHNVNDDDDISDEATELTKESTYCVHDNTTNTDRK